MTRRSAPLSPRLRRQHRLAVLALLACASSLPASSPVGAQPAEPTSGVLETTTAAPAPLESTVARVVTAALEQPGMPTDAALWLVGPDGPRGQGLYGRYSADTAVALGSASQWLAAAVILSLDDAGRLSLDDTLGQLLPSAPPDKAAITLRQLLAHTSGLPAQHPCLADTGTDLASCAGQILEQPLRAAPGTEAVFGHAAYQVAGWVAETAAGRSWSDLVTTALTRPLGLENTAWAAGSNPVIGSGAESSARDFGRFLTMLLEEGRGSTGQVLSASSVEALLAPQSAGAKILWSPLGDDGRFGLGTWIEGRGTDSPVSAVGTFGFSAWLDPANGLAGVWVVVDRRERALPLLAELRRAAGEAYSTSTAVP